MSPEVEDLLERWPIGRTFDLPAASTCIVAGAYRGLVMETLDELYHPERIVGFEPQLWAFRQAWERLAPRPSCVVVPWGLSTGEEGLFPMAAYETDECSFVGIGDERGPVRSQQRGEGRLVESVRGLDMFRLSSIDLAVINMEGYEYRLLPYWFQYGVANRIDRLIVQFHTPFEDENGTYKAISRLYGSSFTVEDDDFPRWVYWKRRRK